MVIATLFYSMTFPAIEIGQGGRNPLSFTATWSAGYGLSASAFLAARFHRTLGSRRTWRRIGRRIPTRDFLLGSISGGGITLFIAATALIDEAVTAMIARLWPIVIVVLMSRMDRYRRNIRTVLPAMAIALVGCAIVTIAQSGISADRQQTLLAVLGALMAITGAVSIGLGAYTLRWASDLAQTLHENPYGNTCRRPEENVRELEMMGVMTASAIAMIFWMPALTAAAVITGENPSTGGLLIAGMTGVTASTIADITWFKAALTTTNLGVHAAAYMTPLLSLLWLTLLGSITVQNPLLLVLGALLIVGANIGTNLSGRRKPSQK